jgi:hypothetical protein
MDLGNRAGSMSGKIEAACEQKMLIVEERPADTPFTNYENLNISERCETSGRLLTSAAIILCLFM